MPTNIDDNFVGAKHDAALTASPDEKHQHPEAHATEMLPVYEGKGQHLAEYEGADFPTEEELATLRRVADKIPWKAYTVAFVELVERFSYYGTTVVFTNFIQRQMPIGSTTGSDPLHVQAGALDKGQEASTGIGTFNQFWVYTMPLFGAYIADTYLGRYNAICVSLCIAIVGHIILTASAIPALLEKPNSALACFLVGLIIMGVGTGGFKSNISPLVAEQLPHTKLRVITTNKGERVIVDPAVTSARVYNWFYLFINVGALVGQIAMAYSELYVGFWLSFLLPTLLLCVCPGVMWFCRTRYVRTPPQGSVFSKAFRLFFLANKGRWSLNPVATYKKLNDGTFWENVKPSNMDPAVRPKWMTFDDGWVSEVRRGFHACSVFLWYPLYWLTYNQLNNNLTSQAAVMALHGIPNDVVSNLDPLALIILIPVFDILIYPALRKAKINLSPIKKITLGFWTGALAMVWATVIQAYIYKMSQCGDFAAETIPGSDDVQCPSVTINVWAQTGSYVLIAISEILASITSLEYAFTKAPKNMRSLVMAFGLFMSAISAAVGEAFVPLSEDPLLVWNYGVMAVLSFVGGVLFWFQYRGLDKEEDSLNMLDTGEFNGVVVQPRAPNDNDLHAIERRGSTPESGEVVDEKI